MGVKGGLDSRCGDKDGGWGQKGVWIPGAAIKTGVGGERGSGFPLREMTGLGAKGGLEFRCGENGGERVRRGMCGAG